jgi:exopolysaccharide biosynthesis polyprenyl glycosylphosphotransferase
MDQRTNRWRMRAEERRLILLTGDFLVAWLSLAIALFAWGQRDWLDLSRELLIQRIPSWFFLTPFVWMLLNVEMYDLHRAARRDETLKGVLLAAGVSLVLYTLVFFSSPTPGGLPRVGVAVFIFASTVLMLLWRFLYIAVFTQKEFLRRVLIVGAGRAGSALAQTVNKIVPHPLDVVGFIDDDPFKKGILVEGYPILGGHERLISTIEKEHISDVVLAISNEVRPELFQVLLTVEENGVEISTMPTMYEDLLRRVPISLLQSDWILRSFVDQAHAGGLYELIKRLLDIIGGLAGTLLTLLALPFIALMILIDSGGPVIFTQKRLGLSGKEFTIIKFRSMRNDNESDGRVRVTTENDDRITRVGRFLRKSRMDELPQFINVLRGEMSLVGPRAERNELVAELQKQVPFYRARLFVKPGITGWAQVNFGYAATVEDTGIKLEYDLYYIKHRSLLLDLFILLRTVGTVAGLKGQ